MRYIAHTRYKGKTMHGQDVLVRRGKVLERQGDILFFNGEPICIHRSLVGKRHFARDDDGRGMERGALTYAMAYAPRECWGGTEDQPIRQRFTDAELETLTTEWPQYLKPDIDMVLFNDSFFEESPDVLRNIAASVNIDVPKTF